MGRYIIRRLLQALPLLFFLSIGMFALIHLLPGGPDQVIFNPRLDRQVGQPFVLVLAWMTRLYSVLQMARECLDRQLWLLLLR